MADSIYFDFEERIFKNITVSQVQFWEKCYPTVDVVDHLTKKMPAWLDANKDGKGRKKKWKRFIVNWLARQQDQTSLRKTKELK